MQPRRRHRSTCCGAYRDGGVTRLSMGVQSMVPHVLAALGRTHDPASVAHRGRRRARASASTSTSTSSTAARASRSADWERSLDEAIALDPDHVERLRPHRRAGHAAGRRPGPPPRRRRPGRQVRRRRRAPAAPPATAGTRSRTGRGPATSAATTSSTGPRASTSAIGCAAHSHRAGRRCWNLRTPERYVDAVEQGRSTEAADERLDADGRRLEGLQLGLRTAGGVPADAFDDASLERLDGLVEVDADRARLTRRGRLLANEVAVRLR